MFISASCASTAVHVVRLSDGVLQDGTRVHTQTWEFLSIESVSLVPRTLPLLVRNGCRPSRRSLMGTTFSEGRRVSHPCTEVFASLFALKQQLMPVS